MLMVKIAFILIISGLLWTFFNAGPAFDTDTCIFPHVLMADGAHGTDIGTDLTIVAGVRNQGFYLPDINGNALPVSGLVVAPVGMGYALYFHRGRHFSLWKPLHLLRNLSGKGQGLFHIVCIGTAGSQSL
jgi:hypothetical protein